MWNQKVWIIDMDGTLYFQREMQLRMAFKLMGHALFHRRGFSEVRLLMEYRKMRENWTKTGEIDREMEQELAKRTGHSFEEIHKVIHVWMQEIPLSVLPKCADQKLHHLIDEAKKKGRTIVIYSDYPAREKADVLGYRDVPCYYGGQQEIGEMKPSPKGLLFIMNQLGVSDTAEVIMIGDRMSRDGEAAKACNVSYQILKKGRLQRNAGYRKAMR